MIERCGTCYPNHHPDARGATSDLSQGKLSTGGQPGQGTSDFLQKEIDQNIMNLLIMYCMHARCLQP